MANTGERVFSVKGRKTQRFVYTPLASGEYDFKIRGDSASIGCKPEPGSVPYLKVQLEALDTGTDESGGRNKLLFHMLFLNTTPTAGGFVMTDKGGQIVDFCTALGEEPDFPLIEHEARVKTGGSKDNPTYDTRTVEVLDPQAVKQWLQDHDGQVVRARSKTRKRMDGSDEAIVDYFIPGEEAATSSSNPFEEDELPTMPPPTAKNGKKNGVTARRR